MHSNLLFLSGGKSWEHYIQYWVDRLISWCFHHSANVGNEADMLKSCLDFSFGVAWSRRNTIIERWGLDWAAKGFEETEKTVHVVKRSGIKVWFWCYSEQIHLLTAASFLFVLHLMLMQSIPRFALLFSKSHHSEALTMFPYIKHKFALYFKSVLSEKLYF